VQPVPVVTKTRTMRSLFRFAGAELVETASESTWGFVLMGIGNHSPRITANTIQTLFLRHLRNLLRLPQFSTFRRQSMPQLFVNRLTVIDFSYLHSVRGLVGESWQVDITLRGGLDDQGMVLDFGDVKKSVKQLIDEHFDHKLLIPGRYPGLSHETRGGLLRLRFETRDGKPILHTSPPDAVTTVDTEEITTDSLAEAIVSTLMPLMPSNVAAIDIHLWPEASDGAYYHYSHGLKHHCGNCQRIAHGHRSKLRIQRNGQRDPLLEEAWAKRWTDIYIGTRQDVVEKKDGEMLFGYTSDQGRFLLQLPASCCYLIDTDSTVENIAQHIADTLKKDQPGDTFRVLAYEGVDKGAIGEA